MKGTKLHFNRQRRKEGKFCASELAGIEHTPPAPNGAGYVRLDHSATVCMYDPNSVQKPKVVNEHT